ncbi:MAG: ribosome silencing factor [bacterium]|nr:ribosome silencing factor [bacterium]
MATYAKPRSTKGRAVLCARVAQEKLAHSILILDLSEIESSPADFFVVCTVNSDAQLKSVSEAISVAAKELGFGNPRTDARSGSQWVILDYFDIIVHVMTAEARDFYKLERLWGDAKAFALSPSGVPRATIIKPARKVKA